jgi:hypothetical protein
MVLTSSASNAADPTRRKMGFRSDKHTAGLPKEILVDASLGQEVRCVEWVRAPRHNLLTVN